MPGTMLDNKGTSQKSLDLFSWDQSKVLGKLSNSIGKTLSSQISNPRSVIYQLCDWVGNIKLLCLSFFFCEMGIIIALTSQLLL